MIQFCPPRLVSFSTVFILSLMCHVFPFLLNPCFLPLQLSKLFFTTAAMFHLTQIHLPHLIHAFPSNNLQLISMSCSFPLNYYLLVTHTAQMLIIWRVSDEPKYLSINNACLGEV